MDKSFQIPPQSSALAMSADKLIERLKPLLDKPFHLSGKPRTDGSSLRKLIATTLQASGIAPEADKDSFEFVPPKKKGVPKLIREMVDTYIVTTGDSYNLQGLAGDYPDIPNQLLEVKVQDKQTVDLGKYTPEIEEVVMEDSNVTTGDIRYLIAFANPQTNIIEGIVLAPGERLGEVFTYVSDTSFKCQRSIPMSFFDKYKGLCVFNP